MCVLNLFINVSLHAFLLNVKNNYFTISRVRNRKVLNYLKLYYRRDIRLRRTSTDVTSTRCKHHVQYILK